MTYVLACGDEGVQLNEGVRLAVVGAGVKLDNFSVLVSALKQLVGESLVIAASEENDWIKQQFSLNTYEQANATMQQQVQVVADQNQLLYAGSLPFADPQDLDHGVRGHMVRPKGMHIANKICFTLAGGEQTYNLGQYLVSAEWVHLVDRAVAQRLIAQQVEFYQSLAGKKLQTVFETEGELGQEVALQNRQILQELGY